MDKINKAINDLNTKGYHKTNIASAFDSKDYNLFNNNVDFFNNMLNDNFIQNELNVIQTNPNERNSRSGGKPFEITHKHYLNRALTLGDGSFFNFYLNDYFTKIAQEFLEVDNPLLFNVLAWIHSWKKGYPRQHSQNWHRDREDYKLLKIFVYYSDVNKENGPYEYVPKSFCGGDFYGLYEGRTNYMDYASDSDNRGNTKSQEELDKCEETKITFTGVPGDIIITNNSGFHRGGFVEEGIRVMTHGLYLKPDAYMIKEQKYFTNFNYASDSINYVDFNSEEFQQLGDKRKHFMQ